MFPQWNTTKTMIKSSTKNQKLHWRKWAKSGESQHCPELKFICLLSKSFRASGLFFFLSLSHMQRIYESVFSSVVQRISSDQRRRSARRILQSCVLLSAHHLCKQFCPSGWIRVCWKVRSKTWSSRPCVCLRVHVQAFECACMRGFVWLLPLFEVIEQPLRSGLSAAAGWWLCIMCKQMEEMDCCEINSCRTSIDARIKTKVGQVKLKSNLFSLILNIILCVMIFITKYHTERWCRQNLTSEC